MPSFPTRSRGGLPPLGVGAEALAGLMQQGSRGAGGPDSPRRSGSNASQLFDALVMAATGGTEGAAAAPAANDTPAVDSRFGVVPRVGVVSPGAAGVLAAAPPLLPGAAGAAVAAAAAAAAGASVTPVAAVSAAAAAAAAAATAVSRGTGAQHQLPSRQRSRLWSALSYGDVDSLQNALDAFRVSAFCWEHGCVGGGLTLG
jgi:hypothetical protein